MYRTLVADDDFLVRSYLKTLDSWEKAGYEIVDDAEDGEEAYGFLQERKDRCPCDGSDHAYDGWH